MIQTAEEFVRLRLGERPEEYNVAAHDDAPLSVWLDVVTRYPEMKIWVVHNKTVPLQVLEILALDDESEVRACVAGKRKLTPELFELLSKDPDESVRQRIACNKKVPVGILKRLALDSVEIVRDAAGAKLSESKGAG